jgi:hypothetical protein
MYSGIRRRHARKAAIRRFLSAQTLDRSPRKSASRPEGLGGDWKLEDGLEPTIAYFKKLVD